MAVKHLVYIYHGNNIESNKNTLQLTTKSDFKFVAIGVNELEEAVEQASMQAALGADCIELCGAFDTVWRDKIRMLLGSKVQVGNAQY